VSHVSHPAVIAFAKFEVDVVIQTRAIAIFADTLHDLVALTFDPFTSDTTDSHDGQWLYI